MADILPFRGLIYDTKKVGDLSLVTSPPYDVISEKAKPKYYAKHPNNVIRLELGDGSLGQDRYRFCAQFLADWEEKGILVREKDPAFYYYQVDFLLDGGKRRTRRGFIGLCGLEEFEKGKILPHERIHEAQKEDRLKLMKICRANLSLIFSLYPDPHHTVLSLFERWTTRPPLFTYLDEDGTRHTVWSFKDRELIRQVKDRMRDKVLFIADGHHRFEAALAYKREMEKKSSPTGKEPFNYTLMYFCPFEDGGLTILPSHRLVFNLTRFDRGRFESRLREYFQITDYPFNPENERGKRTEFLQALEEAGAKGHAFGLYIQGDDYYTLLQLKSELDLSAVVARNIPPVLQKLDVIILHQIMLEQSLGLEQKDQDQQRIQIIKNSQRALDLVKEGAFQMVFLLNPPKVEEVQRVASEREYMPQKSTFFYPKLPSGMVINKLVDDETTDDRIP